MNHIDTLNNKINNVEKIDNISDKIKYTKEIKTEIDTEIEKTEKLIHIISSIKPKKHKKYNNMTLDELGNIFEEENNIKKKLKIYEHITYMIELTKGQLFT